MEPSNRFEPRDHLLCVPETLALPFLKFWHSPSVAGDGSCLVLKGVPSSSVSGTGRTSAVPPTVHPLATFFLTSSAGAGSLLGGGTWR